MSVQARTDQKNFSLIRSGQGFTRDNETLLQDGARATVLKKFTVMAQVAASRKWVPLTDVTKADTGENVARGIYLGDDIAAATLVAGDVTGCPILVAGPCVLDGDLLVFENSLALTSVVSDDPAGADNGVVNARLIQDDLLRIGLLVSDPIDIDLLET